MRVYVCDKSSLEFWRSNYAAEHELQPLREQSLRSSTGNAREIIPFETWRFGISDNPIHVLVDTRAKRGTKKRVVVHLGTSDMPKGSFCMLEKDLYVASPELCFLQAARWLSLSELVKLGFEFCGSYALSESDIRGFVRRDPLTCAKQLRLYLARMKGSNCVVKAQRAARLVADNSASPMETATAMLLTMPCRYGGYGLPAALLNHRINLEEESQRMASRRYFECDLFWPNAKVAVEYDSDQYHTHIERINADAIRRDVLAYNGITVITVTNNRIKSIEHFGEIAKLIAHALGHRIQLRSKDWPSKHAALRRSVMQ